MKLQHLKDRCIVDRDPLVLEDFDAMGMWIVGSDGDVIETVYAEKGSFQYNTILLMLHRNNKFEGVREALESLSRDDNGKPCFCGVFVDNPMLGGRHTQACLKARKALKDAEEVEGI